QRPVSCILDLAYLDFPEKSTQFRNKSLRFRNKGTPTARKNAGRASARPASLFVSQTNTACTSTMYSTVPPAMDSSTLRFQVCSAATAAMAISSGAPWGSDSQETFRRQYTTSSPIMAGGSTLPRYVTTVGGRFFSGNSQKGSQR